MLVCPIAVDKCRFEGLTLAILIGKRMHQPGHLWTNCNQHNPLINIEMKARLTKIEKPTDSRTEGMYYRLKFRLETGEFAMTDVNPDYRNFFYWKPVIKAGVGTEIGGVFLKEGGWKPLKVNADSQVFIIQETLVKEPEPKREDTYRVRIGNPEIWLVAGSNGKKYEITIMNGFAQCTCEAFRFAGKHKTCKHIKEVESRQVQMRKAEQAKMPTLF